MWVRNPAGRFFIPRSRPIIPPIMTATTARIMTANILADAFAGDYVFKIFGSKGTLLSTNSDYKMKYIEDFSKYPERPVVPGIMENEKKEPVMCSEKLEFTEESGRIEGSSFDVAVRDFYQMLYGAILEGKPMAVTPEMAAETIRIIEACHSQNPLPVKYE